MITIPRVVLAVVLSASTPVFAQESEHLRQLQQEVDMLKRMVLEQSRRIEVLERELQGNPSAIFPSAANSTATQRMLSAEQPWHDGSTWDRVRKGMSEAQVISILGRPTSVESVGGFKTLFYRGEVSGSGSVSGNIKLQDDRVWQVNTPVF